MVCVLVVSFQEIHTTENLYIPQRTQTELMEILANLTQIVAQALSA